MIARRQIWARSLGLLLFLLSTTPVLATEYLVVTAAFSSQHDAQETAARRGGWVLDSALYQPQPAQRFLVVRGPFYRKPHAEDVLTMLKTAGYSDAYVRAVGKSALPSHPGSPTLTSHILTVLLGQLTVEVQRHPGGHHPCEPSEPYREFTFSALLPKLQQEERGTAIETFRTELPIGPLWEIIRTGEIQHMQLCTE